jgi:carboxypeptidase family protein
MKPLAVFIAIWFAAPAAGQSIGANVAGIVSDESGARLPGASITIAHLLNGRSVTVTTGREGEYRVVALLPGEYDLAVTQPGFARLTRHVSLLVGADATVDFTLPVASVEVRTTVRADPALVEPARSQPSSSVTRLQVEALPVLERNFLVLAQLLPGAGPINGTVNRFAVTKFGGVADQRSGYTTLVDGGDVDDAQWGSPTINLGQDAVQEFKVFRSQFDAQYGHALNAVVTVATRSGTNQYSGSGFYFGRDAALNARYPFAAEKPPFDEHRIGGTLGGPVLRDRAHFFGAYERDTVNNSRIIALPPSNVLAATENGIFPARATDGLATLRLDHHLNTTHALSIRYNDENQRSLRSAANVTSDTNQLDSFNRSHSLVMEEMWTPRQDAANAFRVHLLNHTLGTAARYPITAISRPAGSVGQTNRDAQVVPRTKVGLSDTFYIHTARHEVKFGGEFTFATQDFDSRVLEYGAFQFLTDLPFDPDVPTTWPSMFQQQKPSLFTYRSKEVAGFLQDDWRVKERVRMNAGLRYDLDLNLRLNDFSRQMLDSPSLVGLDRFITRERGTDTNNVQPRIGATWDIRGTGRVIVRGGSGLYVTRNRPWFQLRSMNQFGSSVVRITDQSLLRHYPDINAVLGGRTLDSFIASGGPRQLGTVIPDDFVQPYAVNTTAGVGWQLTNAAAVDIDYVHSFGNHQVGTTDGNLPASGVVNGANPRPVPQFAQVGMLENFSKSWYDGLETQLRTHFSTRDALQVSYTLSRSYLDGVDFFLTTRGTQRTPHERGYNPSDQRHNLTVSGSMTLPLDLQVSAILKLISGSPIKVQAGRDLDGDQIVTGDLPAGVPITVGRERVDESLAAINTFRAQQTPSLSPIDRSLLLLDPYRSLELRVMKTIRTGGSHRLEILVEAFNLTNVVNLRPPVSSTQPEAGVSMNTASFLIRTAAREARQIQWGLRYAF